MSAIAIATVGLTVGCSEQDDYSTSANPSSSPAPTEPAALEKVQKETREAVEASKSYAYAQREAFAAKVREQIAHLQTEIDQLSLRAENSSAAAKEDAQKALAEVREKVAKLNERLAEVPTATESTWDNVRDGLDKSYDEIKKSVNQARQWLSEKIAP
jgi:leucyl aminopeptidase (aminopeptidase T)